MTLKSILCLSVLFLLLACKPEDIIRKYETVNGDFQLSELNAPAFPFAQELDKNAISITFDTDESYLLKLSEQSCEGEYSASESGAFILFNSNCTDRVCDSDWDLYVITLLSKVVKYKEMSSQVILYIDDENYFQLKKE